MAHEDLDLDVKQQQNEHLCEELSRARMLLGMVIKHVGGLVTLTHKEIENYDTKHSTVEMSHPTPFDVELRYVHRGVGGSIQ